MNTFFALSFILSCVIYPSICLAAKRILILGESGNGKSTSIQNVFKVREHVPIGHTKASETQSVYAYHTLDTSLFSGHIVYDTPGFEDTTGMPNDAILQLIEAELAQIDSNQTIIDGMILMVGTWNIRDRSNIHLAKYIQLFGEDMLPNLMVVINRWDCDDLKKAMKDAWSMREHLQSELSTLVSRSKEYKNSGLQVPIITMDCKNPDIEELETLKNTLSALAPYKLKNLENRKIRIKELFGVEIGNPDNYKNHSENIIDYEMQLIKTQAIKRNSVQRQKTECGGPRWSVNLGFASFSGSLRCKTVTVWVPEDIIVDLEKKEKVPVTKQNVTQVLKNEVEYYWDVAKQNFKQEILRQFTNRKFEL